MFFGIFLAVVLIAILIWQRIKGRQVRKLLSEYEDALKGHDKEEARAAGRRYFTALRGHTTLTALDELEMEKDIAKMN